MMKRWTAALLALVLLTGIALAEGMGPINSRVAQMGLKPITARNKTRLAGCWFTEDSAGDTLQWSDTGNTYTVTGKPGKGLKQLYAELLGLYAWDTCAYTINGKVQFAFNAPDMDAVKNYKTLKNYARYVGQYIERNSAQSPAKGQAGYVINLARKRFHRPECPSAQKIKEGNRENFTGDRDALIGMGYVPCKKCNP